MESAQRDTDDLIREMHGDLKVVGSKVNRLEEHAKAANGQILKLTASQLRHEGAMDAIQGLLRWTLAGMGVGVALAGVVLTLVAG